MDIVKGQLNAIAPGVFFAVDDANLSPDTTQVVKEGLLIKKGIKIYSLH